MIFDSRSGKIKTKITGSKWFERKEDIKQMRLPQIINSLLETDMYKFSMGQTIFHQFTDYKTTWTFKCRNEDVHFTQKMVQEITEQNRLRLSVSFGLQRMSLHILTISNGSKALMLIFFVSGSRVLRILR